MADINKQTSPYAKTPVKEFYLDVWVPRNVPTSSSDLEYTIEPKYHLRPDLLSYDMYGTSKFFWIFARRNMDILIDPIEDFTAGTTIMVPKSIQGLS